jgi:hypothetical protein
LLIGSTGFCKVLQGSAGFYRVRSGFYEVLNALNPAEPANEPCRTR